MSYWVQEVKANGLDGVKICIVGNKIDKPGRVVST